MHGIEPSDSGRTINWGKTTLDYSLYRPGPPEGFFQILAGMGVGLAGQSILDLGTGTGVLARRFAQAGAKVSALDLSNEQIEAARKESRLENVKVDFRVGAAEGLPFSNQSFDAVTANQCWLYFEASRAIPEVKRVLKKGGVLLTSHFCWLPRQDEIARQSEELALQFNPEWSGANWSGDIPAFPEWAQNDFKLRGHFWYDVQVPFTREAWRGRFRACRGIGASLTEAEVSEFDRAHDELLRKIAGPQFFVLHRIDGHLFEEK